MDLKSALAAVVAEVKKIDRAGVVALAILGLVVHGIPALPSSAPPPRSGAFPNPQASLTPSENVILNGGGTQLTAAASYTQLIPDAPVCLGTTFTIIPVCNYNDAGPCIATRNVNSTQLIIVNNGATTIYCSTQLDAGGSVIQVAAGASTTIGVRWDTPVGCYVATGFQDGGAVGCTSIFEGVP